jgi:hypothetical protein
MTELYSENEIHVWLRLLRRDVFLMIGCGLVSIGGFVLFCVFINDENALALNILGSLLLIAGGWAVLGLLFFSLLPKKKQILQTETLLGGGKKEGTGTLTAIGKAITIGRGRVVLLLSLEEAGAKSDVYYEESKGPLPFHVGTRVHYVISEGFLFSYEVLPNE